MKLAMLALCLLLTIQAFAADDHSSNTTPVPAAHVKARSVSKDRTADEQFVDNSSRDDVCYTMRVYMFEAKDGETLQPKGMKTCVASNARVLKKAAEPQAQLKLIK